MTVLRVFLLAIQSHIYSFASRFFFKLMQSLTVSSVHYFTYIVRRKEETLIENHTPFPIV